MFADVPNAIEITAISLLGLAFIISVCIGVYLQIIAAHSMFKVLGTTFLATGFVVTVAVAFMYSNMIALVAGLVEFLVLGIWVNACFTYKEENFVNELLKVTVKYVMTDKNRALMRKRVRMNMKMLRIKLAMGNKPKEEEKHLVFHALKDCISQTLAKGDEAHDRFSPADQEILIATMEQLLFKELNIPKMIKIKGKLNQINKNHLWWNERQYISEIQSYITSLKEQEEDEEDEKEEIEERDHNNINWARLGAQILMFTCWVPFGLFDFILSTTDMVQFYELCGLKMSGLDSKFFFIPNQIYKSIQYLATIYGFIVCILIVITIQTITDYQVQEFNEKSNDFLVLANFFTKMWGKLGKDKVCFKGYIDTQKLIHKFSLAILGLINNYCGTIMTEYGTAMISEFSEINKIMPRAIVFIVFVVQIFDCKFLSMIVQMLIMYVKTTTLKDLLDFRSWGMLLFIILTILLMTFVGFFEQLLFPFEFVGTLFSVNNVTIKNVYMQFQNDKPTTKFMNQIFILIMQLVLLSVSPNAGAILLIVIIGINVCYVLLLSGCVSAGNKDYMDIITHQFAKCSTLEVHNEQNGIWQDFMCAQKCMKYSAIPFVGGVLGCMSGYLNGPPLVIEGLIDDVGEYVKSWANLIAFFAFTMMFGFENKWYWIPLIIWAILFIYDLWDDGIDFMAKDGYGINDLVGRAMKQMCCGVDEEDGDEDEEGEKIDTKAFQNKLKTE
ncbi:Conserved_hypothetical protein [Hexamita inflata]|uniref:Uncharacterized protein n=1 Tax=Hexamita inflata TaxID=28002 RepID=A0ABP1HLR4_9EUKA